MIGSIRPVSINPFLFKQQDKLWPTGLQYGYLLRTLTFGE